MSRKVLMIATLAASVWLVGCSEPAARMNYTAVNVRFVIPAEQDVFASTNVNGQMHLAADTLYDGFVEPNGVNPSAPDLTHVALWGRGYDGTDVTYAPTPLAAGSYTFAFLDPEQSDLMQGWIRVQEETNSLVDFLNKWRNSISELKWQKAYDFEINGGIRQGGPEAFAGFSEQVETLSQMRDRLDKAIKEELASARIRDQHVHELFEGAEVRIMPGGGSVFHAATRPAFDESDLAAVQAGNAVTKIILTADYDDAQWKLRRVNNLYNDLTHTREVARQVVDRFERRKGLLRLTDHLYKNDKRFVDNEIRLQGMIATVNRIEDHMTDLRQRRMALAFISGLVAPHDKFRTLDQEEQALLRERAVFEMELQALLSGLELEDGSKTPDAKFERNRQNIMVGMNALDQQVADLRQARGVLEAMAETTSVIHRHGDTRLLAATFVSDDLPFAIRKAVEQESSITVRLEAGDNVFIPTRASVTVAYPDNQPTPHENNYQWEDQRAHPDHAVGETQKEVTLVSVREDDQEDSTEKDKKKSGCGWIARLLVPPCWFANGD